jgi:ppGpp synthetase/RelA/SpoT-type nucleotidyltranferase
MSDLEAIRERWIEERPRYVSLANHIRELLEGRLRQYGVPSMCSGRAKDVASLLKKALRKNYGYDDIHDKAGVRVVVDLPADVAVVERSIRALFSVVGYEDKTVGLTYDRLAYFGIHFEVILPDASPISETERWRGCLCEIQVHTRSQNAWAEISHHLIYKSDQEPPTEVKRRVYRLMALVELFDDNMQKAKDMLLELPGFEEGRLLADLERWFYRLTARRFDRDLSLEILSVLKHAYTVGDVAGFSHLLDEFAETHLEKLEGIYGAYRDDDRCSPLLFQPEALMVFERLDHDQFRLKDVWRSRLPEVLLRELAAVWGRSI